MYFSLLTAVTADCFVTAVNDLQKNNNSLYFQQKTAGGNFYESYDIGTERQNERKIS